MEQTPKNESPIDKMGFKELLEQLDIAKETLEGLLIEVEQYAEQSQRDDAKEKAAAQFDAILVMSEKIGDFKRRQIAKIKENEQAREIPIDSRSSNIHPII